MIFYKHFMGDFSRDTGHLSLTEKGAYRELLDHCYSTEKPLPVDAVALYRIAGAFTESEQQAVDTVLVFFTETPDGLIHKRVEEEIESAEKQRDANRRNGARGGRPKGSKKKPAGDQF